MKGRLKGSSGLESNRKRKIGYKKSHKYVIFPGVGGAKKKEGLLFTERPATKGRTESKSPYPQLAGGEKKRLKWGLAQGLTKN